MDLRICVPLGALFEDSLGVMEGVGLPVAPLRDAGFLLPRWDDLVAFSQACRDRGVPLHLDGARIWESAPALQHSPAQIAALADSVYVSFYKGVGALAVVVAAVQPHGMPGRGQGPRQPRTLAQRVVVARVAIQAQQQAK